MRRAGGTPGTAESAHYPLNDRRPACWTCFCLDVATLRPASAKASDIGASTAPATGPVATEITARRTQALPPTRLEVINDSAGHRGQAGDAGSRESHFTVIVGSAVFKRQRRVGRGATVSAVGTTAVGERGWQRGKDTAGAVDIKKKDKNKK